MNKIKLAFSSLWFAFLLFLPDEFSRFRIQYYNKRGCKIHKSGSMSANVRIKGKFEMGYGSSIAQNCSISGANAGVFIGENVMIAPNVVIIAFNHGFENAKIPIVKHIITEALVNIENNVWIAANCTICTGVRIGEGSIIRGQLFCQ